MRCDDRPDNVQFRRQMGEIFTGLLAVGLSIQQVQDSPYLLLIDTGFAIAKVWDSLWYEWSDEMPVQGSHDHLRAFEAYFSVLARKPAET